MPSNKKRKSGKGKELATMPKKVGAGVQKGRFDALVTPSPTPSPVKREVEQDWDLEGLEKLDSEGEYKGQEGEEEEEESLTALVGQEDFRRAVKRLIATVALLQDTVTSLIMQNKSLTNELYVVRNLLGGEQAYNDELVKAWKQAMASCQERDKLLAAVEE